MGGRPPARPVRTDISVVSPSAKDPGDMISWGFMVVVEAMEPKRGGYMSPGMDRKDSAGEASNLTSGDDVWLVQGSIFAGEGGLCSLFFCNCFGALCYRVDSRLWQTVTRKEGGKGYARRRPDSSILIWW